MPFDFSLTDVKKRPVEEVVGQLKAESNHDSKEAANKLLARAREANLNLRDYLTLAVDVRAGDNAARFQELQVASQFAEQQLAVALSSLQEARADARRKQAYIDRVAEPSLPDYATAPRRLRGIMATLLLGLLAWGILSMLVVGIREHRD